MKHKSPTLLALALAGGVAFSAPAANAALYNFSQTGFDGGGTVSGSFEATDANNDGWIMFSSSEVTGFTLSFSGNSSVEAFALGFGNLDDLNYKLGTPFLGDNLFSGTIQEGIITHASTVYDYYSGMGSGFGFGGRVTKLGTDAILDPDVFTDSGDLVALVPTPAVPWLLGSALPGFIRFSRRRKATMV